MKEDDKKVERTLVLLKPDAVQRGLIGELISRIEGRGLKLVGTKLIRIDDALARRHYAAHEGKLFFVSLIDFITSGPVVAMVVQGTDAVEAVRNTMGATNPVDATPGTIRGDLAISIGFNLVHGSDSAESAKSEIDLFFTPDEIIDYERDIDDWIVED